MVAGVLNSYLTHSVKISESTDSGRHMEPNQVITLILAILSMGLAIACFYLGARFYAYDHNALNRAKNRYRTIGDVFKGRAVVKHDFTPDVLVQAGMSYNYKRKKFVPNGRVSDEVVGEFLGV